MLGDVACKHQPVESEVVTEILTIFGKPQGGRIRGPKGTERDSGSGAVNSSAPAAPNRPHPTWCQRVTIGCHGNQSPQPQVWGHSDPLSSDRKEEPFSTYLF